MKFKAFFVFLALILFQSGALQSPTATAASGESISADWVSFPKDFKWCVATSAHQIEGGNSNSDWWLWEQTPGHIKNGDVSGATTDHWNRVDEDVQLMKSLGIRQYRLSIEWAKVEPKEGEWDKSVIEHYRNELASLKAAGIEPMVTLHHFTFPQWAAAKGGFEWDGVGPAFGKYAKFVYQQLGSSVRDWVTINEPLVVLTVGYIDGKFPPGEHRTMQELEKPLTGLMEAHVAAYQAIKAGAAAKHRSVRIGMAHHLRVYDPHFWLSPLDHWGAGILDQAANWALIEATETGILKLDVPTMIKLEKEIPGLKGTQDFIGINYYTRDMVAVNFFAGEKIARLVHEGSPVSDLGWEIYPEGIYRLVMETAKRVPGKPILITENGLADATDSQRSKFIEDHLAELSRAIADGAPVEGYCHWSLLDNFEWQEGFAPRFGLFEVNYTTHQRTPRPSAGRYAEIAQQNGFHFKK